MELLRTNMVLSGDIQKARRPVSGNCYTIDYQDSWDKFEVNSDTNSDGVPIEEAYSMYDLPGGQRGEGAPVVGGGKNVCIVSFIISRSRRFFFREQAQLLYILLERSACSRCASALSYLYHTRERSK